MQRRKCQRKCKEGRKSDVSWPRNKLHFLAQALRWYKSWPHSFGIAIPLHQSFQLDLVSTSSRSDNSQSYTSPKALLNADLCPQALFLSQSLVLGWLWVQTVIAKWCCCWELGWAERHPWAGLVSTPLLRRISRWHPAWRGLGHFGGPGPLPTKHLQQTAIVALSYPRWGSADVLGSHSLELVQLPQAPGPGQHIQPLSRAGRRDNLLWISLRDSFCFLLLFRGFGFRWQRPSAISHPAPCAAAAGLSNIWSVLASGTRNCVYIFSERQKMARTAWCFWLIVWIFKDVTSGKYSINLWLAPIYQIHELPSKQLSLELPQREIGTAGLWWAEREHAGTA